MESENTTQHLGTLEPRRLQRLLEISTTISSTLDLKQVLEMVIDTARNLTDSEAASILLIEPATGELRFAAATGLSLPQQEIAVPMEGSIAGWIVQNGQPLILDDVQQDTRHFPAVDKMTKIVTRTMLGVPMFAKGEVIGALEVINKRGGISHSQQDAVLLQALASQAAVAIENARLFQQTDLIAEFMHELKTPLLALTAASEILVREESSERRPAILEMIQRETELLSKMAQDFLYLARLESGRIRIVRHSVDLAALIKEVVDLQQPRAEERQVAIVLEVPNSIPTVRGDAARLKQVLLNLVSNAIKYNVAGGSITVGIREAPGEAIIEVADTGLGIAKEYLPHLFERFYRVPDSEGFTEGTGLGLAIAQRIVAEHGGRIEVQSEPGRGSIFTCYLPAQV